MNRLVIIACLVVAVGFVATPTPHPHAVKLDCEDDQIGGKNISELNETEDYWSSYCDARSMQSDQQHDDQEVTNP